MKKLLILILLLPTIAFAQSSSRTEGVLLQDEGGSSSRVKRLDCVGSSLSCASSGGTGTITSDAASSGTETDENVCTYEATGDQIDCDLAPTDDSVLLGDGSTWVLEKIEDCNSLVDKALMYDASTNDIKCGNLIITALDTGWTLATDVHLTGSSQTVEVGAGNLISSKFAVDNDADIPVAVFQAHSTQTSAIFVAENSAGTDQVTMSNGGVVTANGLTMDANENITLASETLDHDATTFIFSDTVAFPDGAVGTPSLTNTGDTDTGIYWQEDDGIATTIGGSEIWRASEHSSGVDQIGWHNTDPSNTGANDAYFTARMEASGADIPSKVFDIDFTYDEDGGSSDNRPTIFDFVARNNDTVTMQGLSILTRRQDATTSAANITLLIRLRQSVNTATTSSGDNSFLGVDVTYPNPGNNVTGGNQTFTYLTFAYPDDANWTANGGTIADVNVITATGGDVHLNTENFAIGDFTWDGDVTDNLVFFDAGEEDIELGGHVETTGTAPVLTDCGTSDSISTTATDMGGKVTVGTSANGVVCTVTFASTWDNAPSCNVTGSDSAITLGAITSTTVLTISATGDWSSDVVMYNCFGQE